MTFPLWLLGPGLVHDEVVVGRTAVAVLSRHPGQTDTLTRLGITTTADSKLRVTAALLTAPGSEVPEAVETPLALLSRHARLALTLTSEEVTLGELTGLATLAGQAAVRSVLVEAPVVGLALVAPGSLHPGQTTALSSLVVAVSRPVHVAVTRPAVLQTDGVTVEPRLAPLAVVARSVVETELTHPRHSVTGCGVQEVDVTIALTRLAEAPGNLRLAKVSRAAVLTSVSTVVFLTNTLLAHGGRSGRDIAGDGETEQNYQLMRGQRN